ncbi:MAG: GAF domain-containing protein, partial [Chloroflexi bacterium]|nr:GAF domain-containing protein [Chloroflexota bacterium]
EREALAEIGRIVSSSLDIDDVYDHFVEEVRKLIPFDRIGVTLADFDEGVFRPVYVTGLNISIPHTMPLQGSVTGRIIESRRGLLSNLEDRQDVEETFPLLLSYFDAGIRCAISAPLISNDQPIGGLHISSTTPGAYSGAEVELLERVATQIAGAIANSQLHGALQREALQRKGLAEIGRIVSSSLDINQVYGRFAEEVRNLLPFDRIVIGRANLNTGDFNNDYVSGVEAPGWGVGATYRIRSEEILRALRSQTGFVVGAADHQDFAAKLPGLAPNPSTGLISIMMVPIVSNDQVVGSMTLRSRTPHAYSESDLELARQIAAQIAGAIANAQLYADRMHAETELLRAHAELEQRVEERTAALQQANGALQREAEEREALVEIGRIISSSLDINDVYERFAEQVRRLIPFDRMTLNLADISSNTIINAYVAGADIPERRSGFVMPMDGTFMGHIATSGASIFVNASEPDGSDALERFPGLEPNVRLGMRSFIGAPLRSKGEVIAVLSMRSAQPNAYSQRHLALAERIAVQIAGAVVNSQLHKTLQREAAEREALAEIGRIITSSLDISEVYERFTEQARRLIPFDRIALNLVDLESSTHTNAFVVGADVPERRQGLVTPLADTLTERVVRSKRAVLICAQEADGSDLARELPAMAPNARAGIRSCVGVPLLSKGEVIGALNIGAATMNAYTERDLALAQRIADQIAGAVVSSLLHEEARKARAAAEDASVAKSEFLANMSHEIRTPLNGVTGMIDLLHATELTDRQRGYLRMMKTSADTLLTVINDTLDLSKIEARRLDLERIEFDVRELVSSTVDMLAIRAQQEKGLDIAKRVHSDVPAILVGDPTRLRQILVNLVGNAIKFTDQGGIEARVDLESASPDEVVCHFQVRDTGIGIPRDKQQIIFQAFTQADSSTTRRYGGTGLGLAICSSLVNFMGGRIWVESEVGQGSVFHFTARFGVSHRTTPLSRKASLSQATLDPSHPLKRSERPRRILLAEDNRINQTLAVSMLENWGHSVVVVGDGAQAVEKVKSEQFDLVLMDVQMPRLDGIEATRIIREWEGDPGRRVPIIAMTAQVMQGDRERLVGAGMTGYVPKPIQAGDLYAAIESVPRLVGDGGNTEMDNAAPRQAMDRNAALQGLGSNESLLRKMANLFLQEADGLLGRLASAVKAASADDIHRSAHSLKGAVGIFAARRASALSLALETMGRQGDIAAAAETFAQLRAEVEQLTAELQALIAEQSPNRAS